MKLAYNEEKAFVFTFLLKSQQKNHFTENEVIDFFNYLTL